MQYGLGDYENAALSALSGLLKTNGGYLKTLKAYAGELGSEDAFRRFYVVNFPAVLINVQKSDYEPADLSTMRQKVNLRLIIGSVSYRSQKNARTGGEGVYTILKDISDLLTGKKLGLVIRPIMPIGEFELYATIQAVIFAANYMIINDNF